MFDLESTWNTDKQQDDLNDNLFGEKIMLNRKREGVENIVVKTKKKKRTKKLGSDVNENVELMKMNRHKETDTTDVSEDVNRKKINSCEGEKKRITKEPKNKCQEKRNMEEIIRTVNKQKVKKTTVVSGEKVCSDEKIKKNYFCPDEKIKLKKKKVPLLKHNHNDLEIENSLDKNENTSSSNIQKSKEIPATVKSNPNTKYSKFQAKLSRKLKGGQFRWINERLYTSESSDAVEMFTNEPSLFQVYHKGFQSQVQHWPHNPVDTIIMYLKTRDPSLVVADFGCGDAKISKNVPNKVHSFDLMAVNKMVTPCDMKNVPLLNNSVDVAIFCLSLMGTNLIDFLLEAKRVLKIGGTLKIAEVKSRFKDVDSFINDTISLGFNVIDKDESNKMFILLEFEKTLNISDKKVLETTLLPCIYKRR